jgi:hypothetical protein
VKRERSAPVPAPSLPAAPAEGALAAWSRFWFRPADACGLHVVRVATGLLLLFWLLPLAGAVDSLFGLQGWFDKQAYVAAARLPGGPPKPISWSLLYLCGTNPTALHAVYWASVGVLLLFTLGVASRLTAPLTWLVVASFTANPALDADADALLLMLTFYLMLGYLLLGLRGGGLTWAERLFGPWSALPWRPRALRRSRPAPSVAANLAVRLIQVHFALIVVASGLHKLQAGDWWTGWAYWYALYPPLTTTLTEAREHAGSATTFLFFLSLAAYATLAWQIGFPAFAWRRRWLWRGVLFAGGVAGCLGSALLFQAPVFGLALLIGCVAYVSPDGWRALCDRLRALLARRAGQPTPAAEPVLPGQAGGAPRPSVPVTSVKGR